ncbi:MAG: hypothetical protein NXI31_04050 [bacterium]|nr:hypothetical protein [bacterium]
MKTYSKKQFLAALTTLSLAGAAMAQADRGPSQSPEVGDAPVLTADQRAAAQAAGEGLDAPPGAELAVEKTETELRFRVTGHGSTGGKHLGAVIVALQPDLAHFFNGLPPLLGSGRVLAFGTAQPSFEWQMAVEMKGLPTLYAQGVLADEFGNVHASSVQRIAGRPNENEQGVKMES